MRAQIVKASSEVRSMTLEDISCITTMTRDEGDYGGGGGVSMVEMVWNTSMTTHVQTNAHYK